MKKYYYLTLLLVFTSVLLSCVSTNDVRYLQENENLVINEEGLVPYNITEYRINSNDILKLNIVTTPDGDAAQFYSTYNTSQPTGTRGSANIQSAGGGNGGNATIYFNGLKVDSKGQIEVFGIGYIDVVGRTIKDISNEIQSKVNEKFLKGKSEVRLDTDGIKYYILGDVKTLTITGEKVAYLNALSLTQAIAINGGLDRSVDRTDIKIIRKYPEGMKIVHVDLTREDIMNSPYYWIQNGDEIHLNTRKKNLNGFGQNPIQTLTTGVSVLTTAMSIYLILSRL